MLFDRVSILMNYTVYRYILAITICFPSFPFILLAVDEN